jgi:hypothetical protein
MKTTASSSLIILSLVCVALFPNAQAVLPPPDGGYPGFNTAEGQNALFSLTTGVGNTAAGWFSLFSNTDGSFNTAVGAGTLLFDIGDQTTTEGTQNTAIGTAALLNNTTGFGNTANGVLALFSNIDGSFNTATGLNALSSHNTGCCNTAIGVAALSNNTTGHDNTALGITAGSGVTTANNVIVIGIPGSNVSNSCFIGNIRGRTTVNNNAIPVLIDGTGQLGTTSSSRRFKKKITPMDKASESILALKPVTFHYKSDNTNRPEFGLIAEEVAEVNPDLVVRDDKGDIYTVRYDAVNAMVLNEFLKEHRTVQELKSVVAKQEAIAAQQQKQIEALTVGLQKVSAQLELSKSTPQTALNRQ